VENEKLRIKGEEGGQSGAGSFFAKLFRQITLMDNGVRFCSRAREIGFDRDKER